MDQTHAFMSLLGQFTFVSFMIIQKRQQSVRIQRSQLCCVSHVLRLHCMQIACMI